MAIDLEVVMLMADQIYDEMREEEGRPGKPGIQSAQVKALASALVDQINEALADLGD